MRHPRRTILAVLNAVQAGNPINTVATEYGVGSGTVARWHAQYRERSRPDLWLRFSELRRLPSIEAQVVEWIDLMVEKDRLAGLKGLPAVSSVTMRWRGAEVYCRWTKRREVDTQKVRAFEVANIQIPERLRGRGWFRTFIALLKAVSPTDGIIVEEAHQTSNTWMRDTLTSWGFRELFEETYWFDLRKPVVVHTINA